MLGGVFLEVFVELCISLFLCFSSPVVGLNTDGTRKNTQAVE